MTLDASSITPRLWVGAKPPFDRSIEVDVLVLCAREIQPTTMAFRGSVIRCPIPDDYLEPDELALVTAAGKLVANALISGKKVLVTCQMGLNRSAFVAGMALGEATRMSADEIVALIRTRRQKNGVLSNKAFVGYLTKAIGAGRKPRRD